MGIKNSALGPMPTVTLERAVTRTGDQLHDRLREAPERTLCGAKALNPQPDYGPTKRCERCDFRRTWLTRNGYTVRGPE